MHGETLLYTARSGRGWLDSNSEDLGDVISVMYSTANQVKDAA